MYDDVSELSYFQSLVADDNQIPLIEAAAALAQDEFPGLDLQQVLSDIDILAQRLSERCRNASTELKRLEATIAFFYREVGFAGNRNNYYDPANSFIHRVLDTRRGIPISLAVVFIELSRTVGLDTEGIAFPGHFLLKVNLHEGTVIIDPFTGHSLTSEDIHERLEPFRESLRRQADSLADAEHTDQAFLPVTSNRQILLRMASNLLHIYRQAGERDKASRVQQRIDILTRASAA
ncbi:MAG: transglutaminase-like domain-containing protein [Burkholderiaceae bacterium]